MMRYLAWRSTGALVTLLVVSVVAFLTTALVPGNPAEVLLGSYATPARIHAIAAQFGLNRPLYLRYVYWLKETLQGNLGVSTLSQQPVSSLIRTALPVTLELSVISLVLAVTFAVPVGLLLGTNSNRWWTRPAMFGITLGISVPSFVVGLMLVLIFAVKLAVLPASGYVPFTQDPAANLKSMVLPCITLALYLAPPLVRFIRSSSVGVVREDYFKTGRAKGLPARKLLFHHVAPNTLIPGITYLGLQLGLLISGAIVVEVIFALPGMGRLGLNAIEERDYPTAQAVILIVAGGYIVINLLIDLLYGVIDPRVRVASDRR